jgi:hypothetical protein
MINKKYQWIGLRLGTGKVIAVNKEHIINLLDDYITFEVNTFLMPHGECLKERCDKYVDDSFLYHYSVILLFGKKQHNDTPTLENKIKLRGIVEYYLSTRCIEVLGLWYDQAKPPTSHIHFNIHARCSLQLNYFEVLFEDWNCNHGTALIEHIYDPLLARLYLARNDKMYNTNNLYRTKNQIFTKARRDFSNYYNTKEPFDLVDFLEKPFDEEDN